MSAGALPFSWLLKRYLLIFTEHTVSAAVSARKKKQAANERIIFITDKYRSAVKQPSSVAIVPVSRFIPKFLLISQTQGAAVSARTKRDNASERILFATHKAVSAVK